MKERLIFHYPSIGSGGIIGHRTSTRREAQKAKLNNKRKKIKTQREITVTSKERREFERRVTCAGSGKRTGSWQ